MRIMAIGAHPDDLEIGAGATLCRLIREGHEVTAIDLTDGEPTPYGSRESRQREVEAANAVLGIGARHCLHLPNRVLQDNEEARRRLALVMRRTRPEIVLTHVERDAHPDHVAAAAITRGAVLLSRIVKIDLPHDPWRPGRVYHFLCSHMRYPYQPDFVVAARRADFEAKRKAIACYQTQFQANPANRGVETWLETRMRYFGSLGRVEYGEGFMAEEPVCLRLLTDLQ